MPSSCGTGTPLPPHPTLTLHYCCSSLLGLSTAHDAKHKEGLIAASSRFHRMECLKFIVHLSLGNPLPSALPACTIFILYSYCIRTTVEGKRFEAGLGLALKWTRLPWKICNLSRFILFRISRSEALYSLPNPHGAKSVCKKACKSFARARHGKKTARIKSKVRSLVLPDLTLRHPPGNNECIN